MTRRRIVTDADIAAVRDRVPSGWTNAAIAADLGLSESTVARLVRSYGVQGRRRFSYESQSPVDHRTLGWMEQARCVAVPAFTEMPVGRQRKVCQPKDADPCPVLFECLEKALTEGPPFAQVSGGRAPEELEVLSQVRR